MNNDSPAITAERTLAVQSLLQKIWFKKTSKKLQKQLLSLPSDFDGFLHDLGERPERIGLINVVRLVGLSKGNYMIIPVFEVMSQNTKQLFTYEYVSWKHGKLGGYKGIILIEVENKIKYFLIKKGEKFPTASLVYDAIGTNQFNSHTMKQFFLQSNIENQVKKLLEVDSIAVSRYVDLGILNPDPSMTNNNVGLFAMIISSQNNNKLEQSVKEKQYSYLPVGYHVEVHPIEQLFQYVHECNDAYFLSCISRLISMHIVSI